MLSGCPSNLTARKIEDIVQGTVLRGEKRPSISHLGTTNNHQKCINTRWNRVSEGVSVSLRVGKLEGQVSVLCCGNDSRHIWPWFHMGGDCVNGTCPSD